VNTWTSEELNKVGSAEELRIATLRRNGTPRNPVTIWVVRVGDELYVRSYRGHSGSWYSATQANREGYIRADGVEKDVIFVDELNSGINDQINATYRAGYGLHRQAGGCLPGWTGDDLDRRHPAGALPQFVH
jgi:hypothetical protein